MSEKTTIRLQDVIPFDKLRDMMFDLGTITGLRVTTANYKGELIEELENPYMSNSCSTIRDSCLGCMCAKSDAYAGLEAARQGRPLTYRCHMGAAEAAAPIIVNGQYMGCLLAGQALLPEDEMAQLDQIVKPLEDTTTLPPELREAYRTHREKLRPYTLEKLEAASRLMFNITNYIAEMSYNSLIQKQLDEYEINLLRAKNLNVELERNLAMTKLKNMQAQMNPHFLFNALHTISQQAILEGAEETPTLIAALSDILRKTIKSTNQITTLKDEVNYIKSYLHIMQVTLRERLEVVYDVDEACLDAQLPILTVQPLVENAVTHGIELKPNGGRITLSIHLAAGRVSITVSDTGMGMGRDILEQIRALKDPAASMKQDTSIGIKNGLRILGEYFNPNFRWNVDSVQGSGTTFTLRIPYQPYLDSEHCV